MEWKFGYQSHVRMERSGGGDILASGPLAELQLGHEQVGWVVINKTHVGLQLQ